MSSTTAPGHDDDSAPDTVAQAATAESRLTTEQTVQLLRALRGTDAVELKLSLPDRDRRSAVAALGMDPMDAQLRQVTFFDTADLALNRAGVVVRARRVQGKAGDCVVKLRPVVPDELPRSLRKSAGFTVEVDVMPGGFVCSGTLKAAVEDAAVKDVLAGKQSIAKLLTKPQRELYAAHAPDGLRVADLMMLGPINVLKLKFFAKGFDRRLVAELWSYPDGSRVLELSTKCEPADAFDVAEEARTFLTKRGIDLLAEQQTKTRLALEFFVDEITGTA